MRGARPPHPALRADLSPQGEVKRGKAVPHHHLSLGGEVGLRSNPGEGALPPVAAVESIVL